MFHSFESRMYVQSRSRIALVSCAVAVFALLCAAPLSAQTVATYSFEDGTADGWTSFNGASTPVATNAAAYSGSYSLLTTTSSSGAGGPSISLNTVLLAGAQYTITGWVQLTSGESASQCELHHQAQRSQLLRRYLLRHDRQLRGARSPIPDGAQIGGSYTVSTTETALTLYAQLVGATTAQSFYLDDVVITETAPPPGGTPIAAYTFADGGLDGWTPFGSATLTNTAPPVLDPNGDTHSLLTTNRTAGYMGPSLNLLSVPNVVAGATYQVTLMSCLRLPTAAIRRRRISTKTADCATAGAYGNIATSGALSSTVWTKVQGTFTFSNLPGPPTSLTSVHPVQQRDGFLLHRAMSSSASYRPRRPARASRTTRASRLPLRTAAWMAGVRAQAAPH